MISRIVCVFHRLPPLRSFRTGLSLGHPPPPPCQAVRSFASTGPGPFGVPAFVVHYASNAREDVQFRACANRSAACLRGRRARNTRSSGELSKLPNVKVPIRARHPTIHHRTDLGTVLRPVARAKDGPSAWLSPSSDTGQGSLPEAG